MSHQPSTICIRPADDRDAPRIDAMIAALSEASLLRRFLGGISPRTAADELCRELHPGADHFALVAEAPDGAIVGEAYAARVAPATAEVAFVVTDRWQHRHVGSALRDRLLDALRERGVTTVLAETLFDNVELRHLLLGAGYRCSEQLCAGGTVEMRLDLRSTAAR